MAKTTNDAPKGAAANAKTAAAPSLYKSLEAAAEDALSRGDHVAYSTLHPVVVALAGVKFAAGQAAHENVGEDARALLEQVRAL
jgi:hypothetical protein